MISAAMLFALGVQQPVMRSVDRFGLVFFQGRSEGDRP